jgi:hypothetical protein
MVPGLVGVVGVVGVGFVGVEGVVVAVPGFPLFMTVILRLPVTVGFVAPFGVKSIYTFTSAGALVSKIGVRIMLLFWLRKLKEVLQ